MSNRHDNPWDNKGKYISFPGLTIGLITPTQNLLSEITDAMNFLILHQESFLGIVAVGSENQASFQTAPGQLWYIPQNTYLRIESSLSGEMLYMRFGDALPNELGYEADARQSFLEPSDQRLTEQRSRQISTLIFDYLSSDGLGGRMYAEALAALLMSELVLRKSSRNLRPKLGLSRKSCDTVVDYIDSNLNFDVSLIRLAEIAGVSVFHFSQMFKQNMGVSPHQYVLHVKTDRARRLIRETDTSYEEIAQVAGFPSQSHMRNVFRKTLGASPNRYRAMHR